MYKNINLILQGGSLSFKNIMPIFAGSVFLIAIIVTIVLLTKKQTTEVYITEIKYEGDSIDEYLDYLKSQGINIINKKYIENYNDSAYYIITIESSSCNMDLSAIGTPELTDIAHILSTTCLVPHIQVTPTYVPQEQVTPTYSS